METIADRIRQRLEATGKSAHAASIEAGGSPSLIPNILNGRSSNPRIDTLKKIAVPLETTGEWLMDGGEGTGVHQLGDEVRPAAVPPPLRSEMPLDVPVLGTAAGGELGKGAFQLSTDVVDYVRRPAGLAGARDAYALYVEGESMVPRFEPGDLIFVHPHRKVARGDYVVVQEPDSNNGEPRAFLKRFVTVTGKLLRTEQFNPAATIEFVLRPGLIWHKVMTDGDLYGV